MNILIVGHVDHGKTSLNTAINTVLNARYGIGNAEDCGPDMDENRCIGVNRSFAFCLGDVKYQYVDYPGFLDYVDMFDKGEEKFDAAVMVCAACDGPLPETSKMALLCHEHGIEKMVLFLSKTDMADDSELLELVSCEVQMVLEECGYLYDMPLVMGSSLKAAEDPMGKDGDKVMELISTVDRVCTE